MDKKEIPHLGNPQKHKSLNWFERFSHSATEFSGSPAALITAFCIVIFWSLTGPFFNFSNTWQLVINTTTTVITFLMVFLIQRTQNKDAIAMQLKLNELIAAMRGASNRLVNIENLSEEELRNLQVFYGKLADETQKEMDLRKTHSIEEAEKLGRGKAAEENEDMGRMPDQ